MKFIAARIVFAIAAVAALLTYALLRQWPWAFDVALCVGYTILVLGDGLTDQILHGHSMGGQKLKAILLIHSCFLLVVVGIARLMFYLKSTDEALTAAQKSGKTFYDLIAIAVVVVMAFGEKSMLFRPKEEKEKAKATA